jgi:hypothetical protein
LENIITKIKSLKIISNKKSYHNFLDEIIKDLENLKGGSKNV